MQNLLITYQILGQKHSSSLGTTAWTPAMGPSYPWVPSHGLQTMSSRHGDNGIWQEGPSLTASTEEGGDCDSYNPIHHTLPPRSISESYMLFFQLLFDHMLSNRYPFHHAVYQCDGRSDAQRAPEGPGNNEVSNQQDFDVDKRSDKSSLQHIQSVCFEVI